MAGERFRIEPDSRLTNIRVVDGDSLEGLFGGRFVRVRLYGIDAPELEQREGPQCAERLQQFVLDAGALMMNVKDVDHYGRHVGVIYPVGENKRKRSLNLSMVYEGWAYAYTRFGGVEMGVREAEAEAREGGRGVWRGRAEGGTRPWEWRKWNRERGWTVRSVFEWVGVGIGLGLLLLLLLFFRSL